MAAKLAAINKTPIAVSNPSWTVRPRPKSNMAAQGIVAANGMKPRMAMATARKMQKTATNLWAMLPVRNLKRG